jgi:hypothetical protein
VAVSVTADEDISGLVPYDPYNEEMTAAHFTPSDAQHWGGRLFNVPLPTTLGYDQWNRHVATVTLPLTNLHTQGLAPGVPSEPSTPDHELYALAGDLRCASSRWFC